jgi:alpha-L-fucosidase
MLVRNKLLLYLFLIPFLIQACNNNSSIGMVEEWDKMYSEKHESIEWFNQAKFGMFIHWGLYSVPAGVWNGRTMEEMGRPYIAEWLQYVAQIPREEYARLANEFNPVKFDADAIARLARDAGMKYLVITTKHHDGFSMYHSKVDEFNIVDATPFDRDITKELYDACKKHGIEFGIYYSHNIDWAHGGDCQYSKIKEFNNDKDVNITSFGANMWDPSPNSFEEYLQDKAYPQVRELMKMFPGMKHLWYDMSRFMLPEQSFEFYRLATSMQPQILVNSRVGNGFGDYIITGDNMIPADPDQIEEKRTWETYDDMFEHTREMKKPWETVGTLNNSWGYKSYDHDWKSPTELLFWLVEIVSKGGTYMLNIGPKASGEVPEESITNLQKVGKWMKINGEAIYNTQPWKITREGPTVVNMEGTHERQETGFRATFTAEDFWFTTRANIIYAIALHIPENKQVIIKNIGETDNDSIMNVYIPGVSTKTEWKQTDQGLVVQLPDKLPNELGYVIAVELSQ